MRVYLVFIIFVVFFVAPGAEATRRCPPDLPAVLGGLAPESSPLAVVRAAGESRRVRLVLEDGRVRIGRVTETPNGGPWILSTGASGVRRDPRLGGPLDMIWVNPSEVVAAEVYTGSITFSDGMSRSFEGDARYIRVRMGGRDVFAEVVDLDSRLRRARAQVLIIGADGSSTIREMELDATTLRGSRVDAYARERFRAGAPVEPYGVRPHPEPVPAAGPLPGLAVREAVPPVRARMLSTASLLRGGAQTLADAQAIVAGLLESSERSPSRELYRWAREGADERVSHPELYRTPEDVARAMGMGGIRSDGYVIGNLAGEDFAYMPMSGWFRATLGRDRLPRGAERPKVYLTVPVDRMRELLPAIIRRARETGAYQLKFGEDLENLIRDDRIVVHFSTDTEALVFAHSMSAILAERGITGRPPPFTHRVGAGPVGFGFDPRGESWRTRASNEVARAIAVCGSGPAAQACTVRRLREEGIDPATWLPTNRVDSVREILGRISAASRR